jgi:hypothetical protein
MARPSTGFLITAGLVLAIPLGVWGVIKYSASQRMNVCDWESASRALSDDGRFAAEVDEWDCDGKGIPSRGRILVVEMQTKRSVIAADFQPFADVDVEWRDGAFIASIPEGSSVSESGDRSYGLPAVQVKRD